MSCLFVAVVEDEDDGDGDDDNNKAHTQTQNPELYDALTEVTVQAGVHGEPQHHVHDLPRETIHITQMHTHREPSER